MARAERFVQFVLGSFNDLLHRELLVGDFLLENIVQLYRAPGILNRLQNGILGILLPILSSMGKS